eukprot:4974559-Prymnesium_polylepis.2
MPGLISADGRPYAAPGAAGRGRGGGTTTISCGIMASVDGESMASRPQGVALSRGRPDRARAAQRARTHHGREPE